jgi:hypothetical protein
MVGLNHKDFPNQIKQFMRPRKGGYAPVPPTVSPSMRKVG